MAVLRHRLKWGMTCSPQYPNGLQGQLSFVQGAPEQYVDDSGLLHILQIFDALAGTALDQRLLNLRGPEPPVAVLEKCLCFPVSSVRRGSQMGVASEHDLHIPFIAPAFRQRIPVELDPPFDRVRRPARRDDLPIAHLSRPLDGGLGPSGDPHG